MIEIYFIMICLFLYHSYQPIQIKNSTHPIECKINSIHDIDKNELVNCVCKPNCSYNLCLYATTTPCCRLDNNCDGGRSQCDHRYVITKSTILYITHSNNHINISCSYSDYNLNTTLCWFNNIDNRILCSYPNYKLNINTFLLIGLMVGFVKFSKIIYIVYNCLVLFYFWII